MNENADAVYPNQEPIETIKPDQEPIKTIKPVNVVYLNDRLTEKRQEQLNLGEKVPLKLVIGLDPEKELSVSGWTCLVDIHEGVPEGVSIQTTDGGDVAMQGIQLIPTTDIEKVSFGGYEWTIDWDAWGNPCLYPYQKKVGTELGQRINAAMENSIRVWAGAMHSESAVRRCVKDIYGPEVMRNIDGIITQLELYPEIQRSHWWADDIDLRDIAYRGKTVEGAMRILRGEDGNVRPPHDFTETNAWSKCQEIIAKLVSQQTLTAQERSFIAAFSFVNIATERSVRDFHQYRITDLNRRFVIANIIENLLCREAVGWDIYEQHQADYEKFSQAMIEAGYEMPVWFTPYAGNEFRWGFALDGTMANAGGTFFLDTRLTSDVIAHVFDHERIHKIISTAGEIGYEAMSKREEETEEKFPFEMYNEIATETIALVVRNKGNLREALKDNSRSTINYRSGVEALLKILIEVEELTGIPLQGAKLLIDGLKAISDGETHMVTSRLRDYYDKQVAKHAGAFDDKLTRYQDRNRMFVPWDQEDAPLPPLGRIHLLVDTVVDTLQFEQLSENERDEFYLGESFEKGRESAKKYAHNWPRTLLEPNPTVFQARILDAVINDPQAKNELIALIESDYKRYLEALRECHRTGEVKKLR